MIYGAVLAGGVGSRMKMGDMPKQFLPLGNKPIVIHTVEKFIMNQRFDRIYIGVHNEWVQYLKELFDKFEIKDQRLHFVSGGGDRNETIMNIISDIEHRYGLNDNDIIVTHDAVRPFVTNRILNDNIDYAIKYGACDTCIPATDTIVHSEGGDFITTIPERKLMHQGQTPQSFNIKLLRSSYEELTPQQRKILTDACKICILANHPVRIVMGDVYNMKITTVNDYKIAQAILGGGLGD